MNRIKSDSFPNTLSGILFQTNQFTAVSDGQYYDLTSNATTITAARDAANSVDLTYGSLFYLLGSF